MLGHIDRLHKQVGLWAFQFPYKTNRTKCINSYKLLYQDDFTKSKAQCETVHYREYIRTSLQHVIRTIIEKGFFKSPTYDMLRITFDNCEVETFTIYHMDRYMLEKRFEVFKLG